MGCLPQSMVLPSLERGVGDSALLALGEAEHRGLHRIALPVFRGGIVFCALPTLENGGLHALRVTLQTLLQHHLRGSVGLGPLRSCHVLRVPHLVGVVALGLLQEALPVLGFLFDPLLHQPRLFLRPGEGCPVQEAEVLGSLPVSLKQPQQQRVHGLPVASEPTRLLGKDAPVTEGRPEQAPPVAQLPFAKRHLDSVHQTLVLPLRLGHALTQQAGVLFLLVGQHLLQTFLLSLQGLLVPARESAVRSVRLPVDVAAVEFTTRLASGPARELHLHRGGAPAAGCAVRRPPAPGLQGHDRRALLSALVPLGKEDLNVPVVLRVPGLYRLQLVPHYLVVLPHLILQSALVGLVKLVRLSLFCPHLPLRE
mmetsp:Transcript_69534/g.215107  ORF Transcript_69534/g.215107 Transcript_69534/m.215107 type:complete len:367 (+) Transcript_69534:832-1932(+)